MTPLTVESIHGVFKQLHKRETLDSNNPIASLMIVRQKVGKYFVNIDPELLLIYSIYEVLEEILLVTLGKERARTTCALDFMLSDYRSHNPKKQAYSLLYYLYLRSDCDLPPKSQLCIILGITERTLQRKIKLGLQHIMFDIIKAEADVKVSNPPVVVKHLELTG